MVQGPDRIDLRSDVPYYLQLIDLLKGKIAS
jgi:hypothetical protein